MKLNRNTIFSTIAIMFVVAVVILARGATKAAVDYSGSATMTLTPSGGSYAVGSTFSVELHENSGSTEIAVVEADLAYNSSQLQFVSSVVSSEFGSLGLMQNSGGDGLTCLVGSKMGAPFLSGDHLVTTITFKVLAAGTSNISFIKGTNGCSKVSEGSEILAPATGQNVWNGKAQAGTYNLTGGVGTASTPTKSPTSTSSPTASSSTSTTTNSKSNTSTSTAPMTNSSNPNIQQAVQGATAGGSLITIKIVDSNNKIIVGAKVTLDDLLTSVSDETGYAVFKNVPSGQHTVKTTIKGKQVSQIIDVKGVSTEAQSFSVKPTSKVSSNKYIKYIVIVAVGLVVLLLVYILFKKLRKPKDPHMVGAPIISGSMPISPNPPTPVVDSMQISNGLPSAGTVITPNAIAEQTDLKKESDDGQS